MRIQLLVLALIAAAATSAHADDLLNQGKALLGTQGNLFHPISVTPCAAAA
jgi:hypothetical protein